MLRLCSCRSARAQQHLVHARRSRCLLPRQRKPDTSTISSPSCQRASRWARGGVRALDHGHRQHGCAVVLRWRQLDLIPSRCRRHRGPHGALGSRATLDTDVPAVGRRLSEPRPWLLFINHLGLSGRVGRRRCATGLVGRTPTADGAGAAGRLARRGSATVTSRPAEPALGSGASRWDEGDAAVQLRLQRGRAGRHFRTYSPAPSPAQAGACGECGRDPVHARRIHWRLG